MLHATQASNFVKVCFQLQSKHSHACRYQQHQPGYLLPAAERSPYNSLCCSGDLLTKPLTNTRSHGSVLCPVTSHTFRTAFILSPAAPGQLPGVGCGLTSLVFQWSLYCLLLRRWHGTLEIVVIIKIVFLCIDIVLVLHNQSVIMSAMNHQASTHQKNFILLWRNGMKVIKDSTYNRRYLVVVLQSSKLWVQQSSSIFSIDLQKCATLSEVGILVQKLSPTNVDKLNRKLPISGGPQEV